MNFYLFQLFLQIRHFIDIRRSIEDPIGDLFVGVYVSVDSAEDSGHRHPQTKQSAKAAAASARAKGAGGPEVR
jgi:hypothetical protein